MSFMGVDPHLLRASLLGGAVGDSLGAEVDFWSLAQIRQRFPDGITDLPPHDGMRGAVTDDTQMTLFTAEGLIEATRHGILRGIWHPPSHVHAALLRWLVTQGEAPRIATDRTGLVTDRRLQVRRAPGLTCLAALKAATRLADPATNDSKGCGTIMRAAPTALMLPRDIVRTTTIACSALTHGHPTGQLAAAWAELLRAVADGEDLEPAARDLATGYRSLPYGVETSDAILGALEALRDGNPETVERLGGGWVAEQSLSIALYACLAGRGFEEALRIAVTHSGDSDSTGTIAWNVLGVMYPAEVLRHPWSAEIEVRDLIDSLVADYVDTWRGETL